MSSNFYLQEKRSQEHIQDLQREIGQQRMAAELPRERHSIGRHLVSRLGARLVALGTWLERVERREGVAVPVK